MPRGGPDFSQVSVPVISSFTYLPSTTYSASFNTYNNPANTENTSIVIFYVDVTAMTGTIPVLGFLPRPLDPVTGKPVAQGSLSIRTVGTYAIAVPCRSNRYALLCYVLGGTITFSVGVVKIS